MATDGFIPAVKHGPGLKNSLGIAEDPLDLPELLVLKGDFFGGQVRVGTQHPLAVVAGLGGDLFPIDAGRVLLDGQEAAVTVQMIRLRA
jgi:hypothetical protein